MQVDSCLAYQALYDATAGDRWTINTVGNRPYCNRTDPCSCAWMEPVHNMDVYLPVYIKCKEVGNGGSSEITKM